LAGADEPEGYSPDSSCLVGALNALNPNFCWSSCLARRTLHWNQPWTVQMAVGEWSPWAPIEQTWHELVHAISCWSGYIFLQTLFLVDSCVAAYGTLLCFMPSLPRFLLCKWGGNLQLCHQHLRKSLVVPWTS
jgi:hypothetical protein